MLRNKKIIGSVLAAAAFALLPLVSTHAQIGPHVDVTYNNVGFTRSINGGTSGSASGCNGTVIGVYGSSALKGYIQQAAKDFCANTAANPNHYDVEYAAGGDSCPGDVFASTDGTDPIVGVSDVFAPSCAADQQAAVDATTINDALLSVNVVDEVATCPGAQQPNGGAVNPAGPTVCGAFSTDPGASGATSCSPAALSLAQAQLLYNQQIGNERSVGGCVHSNAVQNRVTGSGTRITFCFNVFGPGTDNCQNEGSAQALAPTTGTEVNDVCGPTAADGNYAQGYVTRSAIVGDPRSTSSPKTALQGCGVVTVGGFSGYNGTCNPTNPATNNSPSPVDGVNNCNGDNDVAAGRYQIWGYEHLVTNVAGNAAAASFVAFLTTSANGSTEDVTLTRAQGFMQQCQMGFKRTDDAGPYSTQTATC